MKGKYNLTKSEDKMWFGVCSGIADRFGFDPIWARAAFIFVALFLDLLVAFVAYALLAFVMPGPEKNTRND
jgi:phage shock protein PspC (stress-responsive transcriptional regulator)